MAVNILHGQSDEVVERIADALRIFEADHPAAQIDLYRQNSASVRVRILDRVFHDLKRIARHQLVWQYLKSLPDDVAQDISMMVLLAPEEADTSLANLEFDQPLPSLL